MKHLNKFQYIFLSCFATVSFLGGIQVIDEVVNTNIPLIRTGDQF